MLDYYQAFIGKYSGKTHKHEPTKPTKDPFARFVGSEVSESPEKSAGNSPLSPDQLLEENQIFEERVAIMMFDGGLSEAEAIQYLTAKQLSSKSYPHRAP